MVSIAPPEGLLRETLAAADVATTPASRLSRRYVGPAGQQVHLLEGGSRRGAPLVCLHATAYAGRSFSPFLEAMASRRRVMALDAPGYGASDAPSLALDIEGYAQAVDAALHHASESQVDLLGYHTGALVAAELARQRPDRVRRLVLIGVPYFTGAEQATWRRKMAAPTRLVETLDQFAGKWAYLVTQRPAAVPLHRAFENFIDELRAWPRGWWAHDAAFTFDVEPCFRSVAQPVLVLNPRNHLSEASRRAAAALSAATLTELPDLEHGIFDAAPERLADLMDAFLSTPRA